MVWANIPGDGRQAAEHQAINTRKAAKVPCSSFVHSVCPLQMKKAAHKAAFFRSCMGVHTLTL
jgi:hypothetical protein